jgi:hypothetical protein
MSFDTTQILNTIDSVQYNYYPTTFYKNQYQNTLKNSGYIKIPYTSKSNESNIAVFGSGYVTTNLYVMKPVHSVKQVSYDAELIVEHRSLTNYNDPLYTCFLLKTTEGANNALDDILAGESDTSLDLNSLISSQRALVFKNTLLKSALMVIFTTPIAVETHFDRLQLGFTFLAPYVNNYSILNAKPILGGSDIVEGFTEGMEDDSKAVTVAGYCQPIDETDPSISQTAGVIIPIDSKSLHDESTNTTIRTMLNFFGFFILVLSAFFVTPVAYRILITELVLDNTEFSAQHKLNRANAADVYTGTLFFGFAVSFINYGILNNMPLATIIGFYVFVFLMASIMVLQYQRVFTPAAYLAQFQTKGITPNFEDMEMDWGFFTENISSLFFTKTFVPNTDPLTKAKNPLVPSYNFSFTFLFVAIIYAGLYQVLPLSIFMLCYLLFILSIWRIIIVM